VQQQPLFHRIDPCKPCAMLRSKCSMRIRARARRELATGGALVVSTGTHTGRSPNARYFADQPATPRHIGWNRGNRRLPARWPSGCAMPTRISECTPVLRPRLPPEPIRAIACRSGRTPSPGIALCRNEVIRPSAAERATTDPPSRYCTRPNSSPIKQFRAAQQHFVVIDFERATNLDRGTQYAGRSRMRSSRS